MTNQTPDTILLRGGLDVETPAIAQRPGILIGGYNYESVANGYRRRGGHERLDGRPRPSEAEYWVLGFDDGDAEIVTGDVVTGATSGATGTALVDGVVESGTYGGSDAAGYLVLTNVVGTFEDDENLQVSAVTHAVADGLAVLRGAETDANDATWMLAAATAARAVIAAPTGSGPVRGVFALNGDRYCIRDNAGATAAVLFKATTAGWTAQSLGNLVRFTAGSVAFIEGETITRGSTTAVVRRVVVQSGTYGGSDAAGFFIVSGITSGPFAAGAATGSVAGACTISGAQTAITLPAGGTYDFVIVNFYGAAASRRAYGANGVGRAFEWDGTYFTPIETGLSDALDKPTRVAEYQKHLFLAYAPGALLFSEIGNPLQWTALGGAGENGIGDVPTNLLKANKVLFATGRSSMHYISGTSAADFMLVTLSEDSGAKPFTLQQVNLPYYFDGGAVRKLSEVDTDSGWAMGAVAGQIEKLWRAKRAAGVSAVASYRVRARDHYVLLLDDMTGVTVYLGRKTAEATVIEFPFAAHCAWSGDDEDEDDSILVGTSDGWVMELDKGFDNDGSEISALAILGWITRGNPQMEHRWHSASVELEGGLFASLALTADFDYASPEVAAGTETVFSVAGGGGRWDAANWNEFVWSSQMIGQAEARIDGKGRNIGLAILSDSTFEAPHTLQSLTLWSTPRRMKR